MKTRLVGLFAALVAVAALISPLAPAVAAATPNPTSPAAIEAAIPARAADCWAYTGSPLLGVGSAGWQVTCLQSLLWCDGYGPISVDGVFGSQTRAAVQLFQTLNGLSVDGIVGPATRNALWYSAIVVSGCPSSV